MEPHRLKPVPLGTAHTFSYDSPRKTCRKIPASAGRNYSLRCDGSQQGREARIGRRAGRLAGVEKVCAALSRRTRGRAGGNCHHLAAQSSPQHNEGSSTLRSAAESHGSVRYAVARPAESARTPSSKNLKNRRSASENRSDGSYRWDPGGGHQAGALPVILAIKNPSICCPSVAPIFLRFTPVPSIHEDFSFSMRFDIFFEFLRSSDS